MNRRTEGQENRRTVRGEEKNRGTGEQKKRGGFQSMWLHVLEKFFSSPSILFNP